MKRRNSYELLLARLNCKRYSVKNFTSMKKLIFVPDARERLKNFKIDDLELDLIMKQVHDKQKAILKCKEFSLKRLNLVITI